MSGRRLRARYMQPGRTLNCDHEHHADTHEKEQTEIVISESRFRMKESGKSIEDFPLSLNGVGSFSCVES